MKVLIANRGEIAVRITQAAHEYQAVVVAIAAKDDVHGHVRTADEVVVLEATGPAAYLDIDSIVDAATSRSCTHVHPGYGFLAEEPSFAAACHAAGLIFIGPSPETLATFGDKAAARAAAVSAGVPVASATGPTAALDEIHHLLNAHPAGVVIKAQSAGGGRGLRVVTDETDLASAYQRCGDESELASGRREVFAEQYIRSAHHIEVQVAGDGQGVVALGDRDCSTQRSMQKLVEVAPAVWLAKDRRYQLHADAVALCAAAGLTGLATVEFLVTDDSHLFLEVNPRLQVEHTITEAVTGLDLVQLQFALADRVTLDALRLPTAVAVRSGEAIPSGTPAVGHGTALQCRINAEVLDPQGLLTPGIGTVTAFTPPTGAGVRVDTHLRPGAILTGLYDTLIAKVVVHSTGGIVAATNKAISALGDLLIEGVPTNQQLLKAIIAHPDFAGGNVTTDWLEPRLPDLMPTIESMAANDPGPDDGSVRSPLPGLVVSVAAPGTSLAPGAEIAVVEAMKMQHGVTSAAAIEVLEVHVAVGDIVAAGTVLVTTRRTGDETLLVATKAVSFDAIQPDLAEVLERHRLLTDEARAERLAGILARGRRTARQNVTDLTDQGSFVEYGPLAVAAQRRRKPITDLMVDTPADGVITGTATINSNLYSQYTHVAVVAYDYSVAAGTQGIVGHHKTDRLLEIAARDRLPVFVFAEGGGGRPGDSDVTTTGVTCRTFRGMAELQGQVPLVAIISGRCFAGNAAIAGACDVLIATPDANIGMGGPAMIEGGGLGIVTPDQIGPVETQRANGVIHLVASDEIDAVAIARQYLSYFQGRTAEWTAPDARLARHVVPVDRMRAYDVRDAIAAIADVGSVLELRREFGRGIVTALTRFEGHPCAVLANDGRYLGGAIDAPAAEKACAFLRIVRDFELPLLTLADTPGFMVGPEAEEQASVTHFSAMFAAGAQLRAPVGAIILRKAYGLGVMAMFTGHVHVPTFSVSWPTGELGGMGIEGAVRLAARRQLEAIHDPVERKRTFDKLVGAAYERGRAMNAATHYEVDDVIDPAESRRWIRELFRNHL